MKHEGARVATVPGALAKSGIGSRLTTMTTGRAAARQLNSGSGLTPLAALLVAMVDLRLRRLKGFEQRRTQGVVSGLHDYIWTGRH
ncbi:MAG: hypothetical protein RLZZ522_162 [Verrucomicrobiota bacterium]